MRPHSSASHVQKTSVRAGRSPARASVANARAVSSTVTVPLTLSRAPGPQASRWPHRSLGVHVAAEVTILLGIGVNNEANGAALLRFARLDAAKGAAVSCDRDLTAHTDAQRIERLVVLDQPVIDVHDFGGDITV